MMDPQIPFRLNLILKACLIGTNSETWWTWSLCLIDSHIPKMAGLEGLLNFGEIHVFICETLEMRRICSRCYGIRVRAIFASKYHTGLRVFQLETSFLPR